jgi:hypothetical protein
MSKITSVLVKHLNENVKDYVNLETSKTVLSCPVQSNKLVLVLASIVLSGSELLYDWRFTAGQFVFAPSPLRLT